MAWPAVWETYFRKFTVNFQLSGARQNDMGNYVFYRYNQHKYGSESQDKTTTLHMHTFRALIRHYTVMPTNSDSDIILCLQLLSKTLTCTLHLSIRQSIDHICINPILQIGSIHK